MADKTAPGDELFIHLDLDGLAALMKAAEAEIATERGRLELGSCDLWYQPDVYF